MSSPLDRFPILMVVYCLSELLVLRYKRRDDYASDRDLGSFPVLLWVSVACVNLWGLALMLLPQANLALLRQWAWPAAGMFAAGLALRWYAILTLGRFFTVQVAIVPGHQLVESGLFRYVRHPSYAGLLLMYLGLGIRSGNAVSLAVLVLPMLVCLLYRIRIEEAALCQAFSDYAAYMQRTWRLVPLLY